MPPSPAAARLLDAFTASASQSQSFSFPMTRSPIPAPRLSCDACGAPATAKCSQCFAALYCSVACQARARAQHAPACRVDASASVEEDPAATVYFISHDCTHGGPDASADAALMGAMQNAIGVMTFAAASPAEGALRALARAARAPRALHPQLPRVLSSCALDALADGNAGTSRQFTRLAAFYAAANGAGFLDALDAALDGRACAAAGEARVAALAAAVKATVPRSGLLAALRAARGSACECLAPFSRASLPVFEAVAVAAGAAVGGDRTPDPATLTVRQLRDVLLVLGVPTAGMCERRELEDALRAARGGR